MTTFLFAVRVALSLRAALPFVAGAYLVALVVIVTYVAIMGVRQRRLRREIAVLTAEARTRAARLGMDSKESEDAEERDGTERRREAG